MLPRRLMTEYWAHPLKRNQLSSKKASKCESQAELVVQAVSRCKTAQHFGALNVVQHDWNIGGFQQMGMLWRWLWKPLDAILNTQNEKMDCKALQSKAGKTDFHQDHKGQLGWRKEFRSKNSLLRSCYKSLGKKDWKKIKDQNIKELLHRKSLSLRDCRANPILFPSSPWLGQMNNELLFFRLALSGSQSPQKWCCCCLVPFLTFQARPPRLLSLLWPPLPAPLTTCKSASPVQEGFHQLKIYWVAQRWESWLWELWSNPPTPTMKAASLNWAWAQMPSLGFISWLFCRNSSFLLRVPGFYLLSLIWGAQRYHLQRQDEEMGGVKS